MDSTVSELKIPVTQLSKVRSHPNADKLEIAEVLGWQVVVGKGLHKEGDNVIYIQPDAIIPEDLAVMWDVKQYLGTANRVKSIKLRGEPSHGFIINTLLKEQGDISEQLGITKYEPPVTSQLAQEDTAPDHGLFPPYTDMSNLRHYPDLMEGEEVVITEKIHGTNSRVGIILGERMAGSHNKRRKEPEDKSTSLYWYPFEIPAINGLLTYLSREFTQSIVFGELYGKVQKLKYGSPNQVRWACFDIMVNGHYLDFEQLYTMCDNFEVPMVPVLYTGLFDMDKVKDLSKGITTVSGDHIREGVVVKTVNEKHHPKNGRMILKYVNDDYLTGNFVEHLPH